MKDFLDRKPVTRLTTADRKVLNGVQPHAPHPAVQIMIHDQAEGRTVSRKADFSKGRRFFNMFGK